MGTKHWANPIIVSFNASVVKISNESNSFPLFKNKNKGLIYFKTLYIAYYNAGVVFVNSESYDWLLVYLNTCIYMFT
jgi:hypothetical protein